jgi:hypothetical protein
MPISTSILKMRNKYPPRKKKSCRSNDDGFASFHLWDRSLDGCSCEDKRRSPEIDKYLGA